MIAMGIAGALMMQVALDTGFPIRIIAMHVSVRCGIFLCGLVIFSACLEEWVTTQGQASRSVTRMPPKKKHAPTVAAPDSERRPYGYLVLSSTSRSGKGVARTDEQARAKAAKLLASPIRIPFNRAETMAIGRKLMDNAGEFFVDCEYLMLAGDGVNFSMARKIRDIDGLRRLKLTAL